MTWLPFAIAGAVAQLVDGSLGMGFGLTSSTLLLTLGASAAVASAAVHFAEIGTTLASGVSHWHRENVDKKILIRARCNIFSVNRLNKWTYFYLYNSHVAWFYSRLPTYL